jgi:hypothetical protein
VGTWHVSVVALRRHALYARIMEKVRTIYSCIALGLCAVAARSQVLSMAQLHYLGEIGHLGTQFDERKSVSFGPVMITTLENGTARLQGKDDHGRYWSAILVSEGGVGFTDVWQADFDHNGRPDLLVATVFPKTVAASLRLLFSSCFSTRMGCPFRGS